MTTASAMKISFLGGASTIGASCALLETEAANILVDCGIRFQPGNALPDLAPLTGKRIDAIVLTHAHTDHTGALPVVCDAFPSTPVYATPPTAELVSILLRDALKLMNAPDRAAEVPLYTAEQLERALDAIHPVGLDEAVEIYGVAMRWVAASHILGAAMVHLSTPGGQVLFTGDYSVSAQATVPALARPALPVDLLVSEATYGERLHEDRSAAERRLIDQIREITESGGRVLIPAFAIGRAQEVLRILRRALSKGQLDPIPVYVDGMVRAVCDVYSRHPRYSSRELAAEIQHGTHPFYTDLIQPVRSAADRARVLDGGASIVVASSGMLSGGASVGYAKQLAANPRDAILITGYQDEESPGRALLNLAASEGPRTLRLGEATVEVACQVMAYGLSAHADRLQMAAVIESLRPRTVVLVHGDRSAKEALARALSCRDVVQIEDGQVVVRRGRAGGRPARAAARALPGAEDVARIRELLGPPSDQTLRDRLIAEAWFGGEVAATDVEQLVTRLESLGLVRRDDRRRNRVWVLAPCETDALPDEAALESELKQDNPKGKLLELCMRMRASTPTTSFSTKGAHHVAVMSLEHDGQELRTSPQRAASRKACEQLAARELRRMLGEMLALDAVRPVEDEADGVLQRTNPKGKLLEQCAQRALRTPMFEPRPTLRGHAVRVTVRVADGSTLQSRWLEATALRTAEHAAAAEMLETLAQAPLGSQLDAIDDARPSEPAEQAGPASPAPRGNAKMQLNELRQLDLIEDFGYEQRERRGPVHQPVFVVVAWAQMPGGDRLEAVPCEAGSKKQAELSAAQGLLERLADAGVLAKQG